MAARRRFLTLGIASAALLALGGGAAVLVHPVWDQGKLLPDGRAVLSAIALALLDGTLPTDSAASSAALSGLMQRMEGALNSFPARTQAEFAQLLALLAHPWSRIGMGMSSEWARATVPDIAAWLQAQRLSGVSLKQQTYHALHDLTFAAWYSDKAAWKAIGYELPVPV